MLSNKNFCNFYKHDSFVLISFHAVMSMKYGFTPTEAAKLAIKTIIPHYSNFSGAVIVIDKYGHYGAACHGFDKFPYSIANSEYDKVSVLYINCTQS